MNSGWNQAFLIAAVGAACVVFAPAQAQAPLTLMHVHGLAYSGDGARLMIPSHHGLAVYEKGRWTMAAGPQHDYMGFAATAKHLYSSGHPAQGSGMVNPFGVIRSRDGGRSWDTLGLEGETDFHLLATGWNTNTIYVWNPAPSSRMRKPGLHFTLNEGFAWRPAQAARLQGETHALAVHPDDSATVAIATSKGVFLSRDSGERFAPALERVQAFAVFFDLDGTHLWAGTYDGRPQLVRLPLAGGANVQATLPRLTDDAVAYIAQNPVARSEYAIATFAKSVYLSRDAGHSWQSIAERGKTR